MKSDSSEQRELTDQVHQLAQAALRGELTQDAVSQLEALVTADALARDIYASFILDTVILRTMASQQDESIGEKSKLEAIELLPLSIAKAPLPVEDTVGPQCFVDLTAAPSVRGQATTLLGRFSPLRLVNGYALTVLAVSVFAAAISASVTHSLFEGRGSIEAANRFRGQATRGAHVPSLAPAAYLMTANGCNWNGKPEIYSVGSGVLAGDEISLSEGVAEFRLANGVYLGIEGPASLLLASPSTLVLQHGKVTAHVPWGSDDFKVVAAGCRVVARDAEFGVSLAENKLDIHAFSGEVSAANWIASGEVNQESEDEVVNAGSKKDRFEEAVIRASRALQLTSLEGTLEVVGWCKARPSLFVNKLSMSGPLPVTQAYIDQVLSSQPISYWRFENVTNSRIRNEVEAGPPLLIKDKSSLVGGPENRSAELRSDGNWYLRTSKKLPLGQSEYSVEVWVKPSHLHLGKIVRLACGDEQNSQFSLELQGGASYSGSKRSRSVRLVQRVNGNGRGTSCFSSNNYSVRRWQHLVAVKTDLRVRLYLDGKYAGSAAEALGLPIDPIVVVGADADRSKHKFIGQIDELAIYNRALTKEEIRGHYEAVNKAAKESTPNGASEQSVQFRKEI